MQYKNIYKKYLTKLNCCVILVLSQIKGVLDNMFIFERLRKCREEKGLTQTDLMFKLDKIDLRISRPTLIHWETGITIPDANEVAILASFFDKPIQYFFD